jgi:hypothetical protein
MVALLFSQRADAVHEVEPRLKIGELVRTEKVVIFGRLPFGNFGEQGLNGFAPQGCCAAAAGHTGLIG